MKKFNFKLEPLLKYRQYLERIAQQKTAKAHLDVKGCEQEISRLEQTWDDQSDAMGSIAEAGVPGSLFQQYHQYLVAVESDIAQEHERKDHLEKVLNEKLLELKKRSVDKQAMEIYQDRLKEKYTHEMLLLEQKELDEISTLKTARIKTK